jgi:hypothetical protein
MINSAKNTATKATEPELSFERRRYGRTTYTWVYVNLDGRWVSLGDPWPCVTPKRSEIREAVSRVTSRATS